MGDQSFDQMIQFSKGPEMNGPRFILLSSLCIIVCTMAMSPVFYGPIKKAFSGNFIFLFGLFDLKCGHITPNEHQGVI